MSRRPTREQRRDRANAIWLCGTVLGLFAASGIGALIYGAANAPAPAVVAVFSIPIALAIVARFAYIGISVEWHDWRAIPPSSPDRGATPGGSHPRN